jgi:tRNA (cytidine/uridine-2'-O-)-methyltransferase
MHIVLVHPEIHWNTGNAGRTALAAGAVLHLVEPLGFSLDEREVRRAGLDYWEHVDVRVWPSWEAFEQTLPALGPAWFFSSEAPQSFWDVSFGAPQDAVLVFGCEAVGLPAEIRDRYRDRLVAIPMQSARVRSLNLSTSVAVAAYEVLRQARVRR